MNERLLAVDLGLRTGFAAYSGQGQLLWYRSQHYASHASLRRACHAILRDLPDLQRLVLEGGGPTAEIWARAADRRGLLVRRVAAETWRARLFSEHDRKLGHDRLKQVADTLARRTIQNSEAPRPTSLRHDAAEAILIGLWGVLDAKWINPSSTT